MIQIAKRHFRFVESYLLNTNQNLPLYPYHYSKSGEDLDNKLAVEISWERMAMTKGQLNAVQDERQQDVEKHMGYIGVALAIIQHDRLRVEQALRRTGLRDLLQPVLSDYQQIEFALRVVQDEIRKNWDEGQQSRWNMPD